MGRRGFWAVVVVAILIGLAAITASILSGFYGHELTKEFARAVGEALVIAGFIAATVDRYVKGRLLWETSHDISKYLIGYNLPKEIQDAIRELMGTALIRQDFEQHYTFARHSDTQFKLTVSGKYRVLNCSNSTKDFIPRLDFEKHERPTILEFRCDSADRKAVDRKTGNQELAEKHDGVLSMSLKKIKLQPDTAGISYRVSYKYSRLVNINDSDILSFISPTIGLTITAEPSQGISFVVGTATVETENRWEFHTLFLEGQHIHVRWFKADDVSGQEFESF